ncbi:MAG: isopentenyl phosphate kinase family protein [Anaerolineae bacterium]|nr:isopentenyl phosphate kinase family protein [Anaerolineae bacterium]
MLTFLKLGGSLITDKSGVEKARTDEITRLSAEIASALQISRDLSLIVGHGSGSFGHTAARQYGTRTGVQGKEAWQGFARVAYVASRLNHLLVESLHEAGVPVLRIQPSASAICHKSQITQMSLIPLQHTLTAGLVPIVYGDVAIDDALGGTIISTEEIFAYLAEKLTPDRILIAGDYEGVLDANKQVIPSITPPTLADLQNTLCGSDQVDVTGGMASKVSSMLSLCETIRGLKVHIFSGRQPGNVFRALTEENIPFGTRLSA